MDEIGDLITALPVFYNLHTRFPNAKQTLVCKSFNTIFLKHTDYVQCVNDFAEVSETKYDLVIDLRGTEETRKYSLTHKPKLRLDRGSIRLKNKFFGGQKNEIDTNLEIIAPLLRSKPAPQNKIIYSQSESDKVLAYERYIGVDKYVVLHLGARDKSRRWPSERFAECINYINNTYQLTCLLVGGPDDNEVNNECLKLVNSKQNFNVVGEFNLIEFAALCDRASLFVGNESGPLHIAAAMNTPNIALFGPGVHGVFYPKNEKSIVHHYFLSSGHKSQTIENSTIFNISVDEVKESIDKMLKI